MANKVRLGDKDYPLDVFNKNGLEYLKLYNFAEQRISELSAHKQLLLRAQNGYRRTEKRITQC